MWQPEKLFTDKELLNQLHTIAFKRHINVNEVLMQPGDVIVLSSLVVHRTGERGDGSVRVAVSSQFGEAAR